MKGSSPLSDRAGCPLEVFFSSLDQEFVESTLRLSGKTPFSPLSWTGAAGSEGNQGSSPVCGPLPRVREPDKVDGELRGQGSPTSL